MGRITKNKKKNVNKNDHTYVGVENCRQVSEIYSPVYDVTVCDCKILKRMRNWLVSSVCRLVGRLVGRSVGRSVGWSHFTFFITFISLSHSKQF